jgi:hypothetical protein
MTTDHEALLKVFAPLIEQYMESQPTCFVCCDWPATTPMVYIADITEADKVHGCCFAACAVCWCSEGFQVRVNEALRQDQREHERAVWN